MGLSRPGREIVLGLGRETCVVEFFPPLETAAGDLSGTPHRHLATPASTSLTVKTPRDYSSEATGNATAAPPLRSSFPQLQPGSQWESQVVSVGRIL
ncbi:unnamed protein product [Urochloa humidicola]